MNGKALEGKRILMVVAPVQFRDEELNQPKEVFEKEGAKVTVASNSLGVAKGMFGAKIRTEVHVRDAAHGHYDAIVIVGGAGSPLHLWPDVALQKFAREMKDAGKVVAAICLSTVVLARAGVLKGLDATVFETKDSVKELEKGGARYVKQDVVVSGKVVTANGPQAAKQFAESIVSALKS